jgi:hypothetical protein
LFVRNTISRIVPSTSTRARMRRNGPGYFLRVFGSARKMTSSESTLGGRPLSGALRSVRYFARFFSRTTKNTPRGGVVVGAVEDGDVADAQILAYPLHFAAVGNLDAGHAGEGGEARGHVAAHVELGRGLLAAVARPVDGFERQGQDRGVQRVRPQ